MRNSLGPLFTIALLAAVSGVDCQCNWTVEVPQIRKTPVRPLARTEVVCHDHIMVLYDDTIDFPFATYAIHTKEQMHKLLGGRKSFVADPIIPLGEQHLNNDTIFHAPYSRGHLTPSHIMSYNKSSGGPWEETYYMSNILPQSASFNEGAWEKFEANIVDVLGEQPDGTVWEIYTGGLWNGKYTKSIGRGRRDEPAKDYLFWKAFCDRKHCNSGMITALHHENRTRWDVRPVNMLLPGIFTECCPGNHDLYQWRGLLNGVTETDDNRSNNRFIIVN